MMTEHFVTLFDGGFLPLGLALHASLRRQDRQACLWVVCMDDATVQALRRLARPGLEAIPLSEVEDDRHLAIKPGRSAGEYCWTMTSFTFDAVFRRAPQAERVTYLDADTWFLGPPAGLLDQLGDGAVLVTEHGFPERRRRYWEQRAGRFCVQFLTMTRREVARRALDWWQARCLEWCFARWEDGKFGDQLYLDQWPSMLGDGLRVVRPAELCQGPWNVAAAFPGTVPILYHFHEFRFLGHGRVQWCERHPLGAAAERIYPGYVQEVARAVADLRIIGVTGPWDAAPRPKPWRQRLKAGWFSLRGLRRVVSLEGA